MSVCPRCGFTYPYETDRCPNCLDPKVFHASAPLQQRFRRLSEWADRPVVAHKTGTPFDAITGAGVPEGASILFTGAGGLGKSSWALVLCHSWPGASVYYPYETGAAKLRQDAERLHVNPALIYVSEEDQQPLPDLRLLLDRDEGSPILIVVDSLQEYAMRFDLSLEAAAQRLTAVAHRCPATVLMIGHVTKEGDAAGPERLKHEVDVWIELESGFAAEDPEMTVPRHCFAARQKNRCGPLGSVTVPEPWA